VRIEPEVKGESRRDLGRLLFRRRDAPLSQVGFFQECGAFSFKRQPSQGNCDLPANTVAFALDRQSGRMFKKPLSKGREEIVGAVARSLGRKSCAKC
jgi:hypothetical protein